MRGYYHLTEEQIVHLRKVVSGKTVADLGCGDGSLSEELAKAGATVVHAVDKDPALIRHPRVVFHGSYFSQWKMPEDVQIAIVSWPQNNGLPGLAELLNRIGEVLYLGKNTDGTSCGSPSLFSDLIRRNVTTYLPDRRNVMIRYESRPRENYRVYHEELSALDPSRSYNYNPSRECRDVLFWRST